MDELGLIQDALKAALLSGTPALPGAAGKTPVDLGFPDVRQQEHIWISGGADGDSEYDLTSGHPSSDSYGLTVWGFVEFAGTYEDARARLFALRDCVREAVLSLVPDSVSMAMLGRWQVHEGRGSQGQRQLAFEWDVEFTCW